MGANISNPRKLNGALNASDARGNLEDALPARRCRCASHGYEPWLERDPDDGSLHCLRCGSDYTR